MNYHVKNRRSDIPYPEAMKASKIQRGIEDSFIKLRNTGEGWFEGEGEKTGG